MTADAETLPKSSGPPKRRLRNFLLDARFQLKYTSMVVLVTVAIAACLGYFAYDYSKGQTESLSIQMAMQPDLHPDVAADLEGWAEEQDQKVLLAIVGGIAILALVLGFTGIMVTHKVVGPAYKLRRLLGDVADGHLKVQGRLRKGDELQNVFLAFERMVESLRERQKEEISQLDAALQMSRDAGTPEDALLEIVAVRERMQAELD